MTELQGNVQAAEVCLPTSDLTADLNFFTDTLGFRLDTIFPADDPSVATISGHGVRIRLERGARLSPGVVRLSCRNPEAFKDRASDLVAPNGTRIVIARADPPLELPATSHAFVV